MVWRASAATSEHSWDIRRGFQPCLSTEACRPRPCDHASLFLERVRRAGSLPSCRGVLAGISVDVKSVPLQSFGPGLEIMESVSIALFQRCINSTYSHQAPVFIVCFHYVCVSGCRGSELSVGGWKETLVFGGFQFLVHKMPVRNSNG